MSIPPESQTPDDDVPSGNGPSASERTGRALELLAQVRSGVVPGSMLQADARQSLVVLLTADGVSSHEIAQILQVSDRTIERDRRAIRAGAAVSKDPKLVGEMVGRLMAEAELSIQRIRRTARERDVDAGIKVDAEHRCFEIMKDLVHSLQSLGYLPLATQRLQADLTHHAVEIPSLETLNAELNRMRTIAGEGDPHLALVEGALARAAAASALGDYQDSPSDGDAEDSDPQGDSDGTEELADDCDEEDMDDGTSEEGSAEDVEDGSEDAPNENDQDCEDGDTESDEVNTDEGGPTHDQN